MSDSRALLDDIKQMIRNNLGRPIAPEVILSHFEDTCSLREVRRAIWYGISRHELHLTTDLRVGLDNSSNIDYLAKYDKRT